MILVVLGTQKFQFNRLLKMVDNLVSEEKISDIVVGQIGHSTYLPKNFGYQDFFDSIQFNKLVAEADIIITHGGVGSISTALKNNKKVVVVPRQKKYGEHVDDHQKEIAQKFKEKKFLILNEDLKNLNDDLERVKDFQPKRFESTKGNIIKEVNNYLSNI